MVTDSALYFENTDEHFDDNVDYHFKDLLSGRDTPEAEVKHLLEGWAEWKEEETIETAQSDLEMLDAYDAFVTKAVARSIDIGRRLHMAIHAERQERAR